jgi:hypothetical protein
MLSNCFSHVRKCLALAAKKEQELCNHAFMYVPTETERSTRGDALGFGQRRVQISARAVEAEETGAGHVSCQRALESAEKLAE